MNLDLQTTNTWSTHQITYLRLWYGIKSDDAIAHAIKKSVSAIRTQAQVLRVTKADNRARNTAATAPNQPGTLGRARKMPMAPGLHCITATAMPYGPASRTPGQNPVPTAAELAARRKSERLEAASSATPVRNSTMRGAPYTCPELCSPSSRPGAMDAFRLPSRTSFGIRQPQEH